ncbi:hypothetical protein BO70DRAFT_135185 [Aspergillus heteromorphus CBS 117.55]|uniref:Uncharacterized protein n=1 Tax=Aspergillus heteromorphus CBS 117.55 TaxID=1448321 RepID=A0A317X0V9_9EURO|nr:uncharacterized protein BO70DRAFT_135185 [Aspergillus heteromorphus CBS 117.55]PWY90150.1 hypothetical protein BO70DRAFT_135185 [Aspergillus heteromorphus CBS 117.55]
MLRYKPTRVSLGEEDLRYHLERLLSRHSHMAEWHQQDLDQTGYSDDEAAFLDSDPFSSPDPSSSDSLFCGSDQAYFSDQGFEQASYNRDSTEPRASTSSTSTGAKWAPPRPPTPAARGFRGVQEGQGVSPRHSLLAASIEADPPLSLAWTKARRSWVPHKHSFSHSHPLLLQTVESDHGAGLLSSVVTTSPLLLTDTPHRQHQQRQTGESKQSTDAD